MIKIDKNVPIPNGAGPHGQKYPFPELQVGDSFLFPFATKRRTTQSLAWQWAKKTGRKFIVRKTTEGLRCWRME